MKKITLLIVPFLIAGLLQGCVAVGAAAAGGAAGTSVARDKRTLTTMADDQGITYQIEKQLVADPDIHNNAHISVATYNGVVLLVGQAPTADLRDRAVQFAQAQPKVKRVFNEITIGKPTSIVRRSQDAMITSNVKARMVATTNLEASRIKIVTENGVVYLMGLTTRRQADIAAIVTRNSSGVQKVVKLIEYVDTSDTDNVQS